MAKKSCSKSVTLLLITITCFGLYVSNYCIDWLYYSTGQNTCSVPIPYLPYSVRTGIHTALSIWYRTCTVFVTLPVPVLVLVQYIPCACIVVQLQVLVLYSYMTTDTFCTTDSGTWVVWVPLYKYRQRIYCTSIDQYSTRTSTVPVLLHERLNSILSMVTMTEIFTLNFNFLILKLPK